MPTTSVPTVHWGFFPLDETLDLLPGSYSPSLIEAMVRLGTHLPFKQVPPLLFFFCRVSVSAETVRRVTERAGAAQVQLGDQALVELELDAPDEPAGPPVQQVSADGAMVPLVGGSWTEVRTIAIGALDGRDGTVRAHDLTSFSRRCIADQFIRQATLPTYERGTRGAETVVAVMDGAPWLQELIDEQCPAAVRIIDFAHAVSYLSGAAQAAFGAGSREAAVWLDEWAPRLKRGEPEAVLAAIRALPTAGGDAAKDSFWQSAVSPSVLDAISNDEQTTPRTNGLPQSLCDVLPASSTPDSATASNRQEAH